MTINKQFLVKWIIFETIIFSNIPISIEYRFELAIDIVDKCQNNTCGEFNNITHTMCISNFTSNCANFQIIQMRRSAASSLLMGHNGIRNKIAWDWQIANINLLHWSLELAEMAHNFLYRCTWQPDECNYIVFRNLSVGQNLLLFKANPGARWTEKTIRNWYSEFAPRYYSFGHFKRANPNTIRNFTQMIWPRTEYVGCAAATISNGFLVVCYYHPRAKLRDLSGFNTGQPCSDCTELRPTCSRIFNSLCGFDIPLPVELPSRAILLQASLIMLIYAFCLVLFI